MDKKIFNSFKALGNFFWRRQETSETKEDKKPKNNVKQKQQKKSHKEALEAVSVPLKSKIKEKSPPTTPILGGEARPKKQTKRKQKEAPKLETAPPRSKGKIEFPPVASMSRDEVSPTKQTEQRMSNADLEKFFDNVELQQLNVVEETSIFKSSDVAEYNGRLARSEFGVTPSERDKKILVLGVDFGSTCSKVIVRFPYETIGNAPEAIPAVPCMADETNPYYWKSEVFREPNGIFSLIPNNSLVSFNDLKMSFIRRAERGKTEVTEDDVPVIAYLALMVKQSLGWAAQKHPNFLVEDMTAELNFGFPTKSFEKTASLRKFETVLKIVSKLVEEKVEISLTSIKKYMEFSQSQIFEIKTRFSIIPEIVAAVTGFANSNESRVGEYIIIDIGGLSIDYAFFKIREYPSSKEINFGIIAAGSKKHGVEILKNADRSDDEMSRVLYMNIFMILEEAYRKRSNLQTAWRGTQIPVFFTGGGRELPAYRNSIRRLNVVGKPANCYRRGEIQDIHRFNGLDHSKVTDRVPNRLIVAYGLSFPELEIPDWYTPDEHRAIQQPPDLDFTSSYIGPEQV